MHRAPEPSVSRGFVAAVFFGLILSLGAAGFSNFFQTPLLEYGDIAANALRISKAKEFAELYGNYSRFEFSHPGPAFFYVYAAGEWLFHDLLHLSPSPGNAHPLAGMLLQAFFLALALGIFCQHFESRALRGVAFVAGTVYLAFTPFSFLSIWPPHVLAMPVVCCLVACISVACGRFRDAFWGVLAGGFAFHGHVAQTLFVGGLGGFTVFLVWRRQRAGMLPSWREIGSNHRRRWYACGALVFLFMLPPIIDVLTGGLRSNVATILGRFLANSSDSKSMLQAFLYFLSFGTRVTDQETLFTSLGPATAEFFRAHAWLLAVWSVVFVIPSVLAWRWRDRLPAAERRFLLTAGSFLAVAVFLCILWGKAQAGPMFHFNGHFYYIVYFFALLVGCGLLARYLDRVAPAAILWLACTGGAVMLATRLWLPPIAESKSHLEIAHGVAETLQADPTGQPKLLVFAHVHWPEAASVALALQRRGVPFKVWPWWRFLFESRDTLPDNHPALPPGMSVWWIADKEAGGIPITSGLSIFTQPPPLDPQGGTIAFGRGQNAFRYVVSGIAVGKPDSSESPSDATSTNASRMALLFAPQPAARDVQVTFDAQALAAAAGDQPAELFFNDRSLGTLVLTQGKGAAATIPAALWNSAPEGRLELYFPQALVQRWQSRPDYEYRLAWSLRSISFALAPAAETAAGPP